MTEEKRPVGRPKVNSSAEQELDKVAKQFEEFDGQVKEMTMDRMNQAPVVEKPPQVELSQRDLEKKDDIYLKPIRSIGCKEKFNEKYREAYEYDSKYVRFEAENHEMIGETIEIWTRPYPGMSAQEWKVPTNTPVYGPRYLAEQLKRKRYHRLVMKETSTRGSDHMGQYYGSMAADSTIQRLDARPVSEKKSFFMGARNF